MIDIEKERVEFERSSDLQLNSGDLAYKDSKGNYIDRDIKIQWKAWLAAKESAQKEIDQLEIIYQSLPPKGGSLEIRLQSRFSA